MKWYYWIAVFVLFVLAIVILIRVYRKSRLTNKYQNEAIVDRILDNKIWQGMTKEQLLDPMGEPESADEQVLKTKSKAVWKYGQVGHNRFSLKVNIENNLVIGWTKKT